jgi:hypothetical protein
MFPDISIVALLLLTMARMTHPKVTVSTLSIRLIPSVDAARLFTRIYALFMSRLCRPTDVVSTGMLRERR